MKLRNFLASPASPLLEFVSVHPEMELRASECSTASDAAFCGFVFPARFGSEARVFEKVVAHEPRRGKYGLSPREASAEIRASARVKLQQK